MKRKSRVGETRLSLPKSISPSSDSLSTATHVAIKYTDDFIPNLSRIPHESIPSLSPTSFSADFNLKGMCSSFVFKSLGCHCRSSSSACWFRRFFVVMICSVD
ncbi:hypothetical protein Bca101_086047 [Brassica carinata]